MVIFRLIRCFESWVAWIEGNLALGRSFGTKIPTACRSQEMQTFRSRTLPLKMLIFFSFVVFPSCPRRNCVCVAAPNRHQVQHPRFRLALPLDLLLAGPKLRTKTNVTLFWLIPILHLRCFPLFSCCFVAVFTLVFVDFQFDFLYR